MEMSSEDKDGALIIAAVSVLSLISAIIVRSLPDIFGELNTGESFVAAAMLVFYFLLAILLLSIFGLSWLNDKIAECADRLNKRSAAGTTA